MDLPVAPRQPCLALALALVAGAGRAGVPPAPADPPAPLVWLAGQAGRGIGPPGGEVRALAAAPSDPQRVYAGTASGRLFVSDDGAARWRDCGHLPADAVIDALAVDPRASAIAYAAYWLPDGGGGAVSTQDGGRSWHTLPIPGGPALRALAVAPSAPDTILAGGPGGVWRSDDRGRTWSGSSGTAGSPRMVESLAIDPENPARLYAGTWRQPYRSLDRGSTWSRIGRGMDLDRDVFTIAVGASGTTLLAGTCGFLYASADGGDSWSPRRAGIPFPHRRIQALTLHSDLPGQVWAGTRGGLYRSHDGGARFDLVVGEVSVSALDADASGHRVLAATEELGVIASRDGGPFAESNAGLDAARVIAFDASPADPQILFAARGEGPEAQSIQVTTDAGRNWSRLGPRPRFDRVRFLRARPGPVLQVLVVPASGAWSWLGARGEIASVAAPPGEVAAVELAGERRGPVLAATSAGLYVTAPPPTEPLQRAAGRYRPWRRLSGAPLSALAVQGDRFLAAGAGVVVRGRLSAWPPAQEGRPTGLPAGVLALALSAADPLTAYAITASQVLRSDDGGASWRALPLPWPAADLRAIAVDPADASQVVAVDFHGALLRGSALGEHWRVLDRDPTLAQSHDLRMSAAAPGLALVATHGQGVRVIALGEPAGSDPVAAASASPSSPAPAGRARTARATTAGRAGASAEADRRALAARQAPADR